MIGRSNTLAHAAAKQVALARRGEPVMFNPLYIHAGVGLGKTHLLQATTWAGNNGAERKVLYLTAEKFMYGFVSAPLLPAQVVACNRCVLPRPTPA